MTDEPKRTLTFGTLDAFVIYSVAATCPGCGRESRPRVNGDDLRRWKAGEAAIAFTCPTCGVEATLSPPTA